MTTYQLLRSHPDVYDALVDVYNIDMSDYEHTDELFIELRKTRDEYNAIDEDAHADTMAANLSAIMAMISMITSLNQKPDTGLTFTKAISTHHTGGNCMVDVIELNDGHYVGINDESVCLYAPDVKPEDFLYQDIGHIYLPA